MGRKALEQVMSERNENRQFILNWNEVPVIIDIGYAQRLLGFNRETIRKLCVDGTISALKIGDEWRIPKEGLMKLFQPA